jgi:F-type H+-transporting ATPase subunit gamma
MASLKDLRLRIRSVKSTQKITSAMKMVAAAKLRRAQEQAEAARPYAERMERMIATLGAGVSSDAPVLLTGTGSDKVQLVIVATADRGLCGAFNSSIIRDARLMIRGLQASGKTVKL